MDKIFSRTVVITTKIFLILSVLLAGIWIVEFAGIIWTPDQIVPTFWQALIDLAKGWAPLFVPVAAIIFVIKNFQATLTYEICRALKPELELTIKDTVSRYFLEGLDQKIARHTLLGIRSVCRSLSEEEHETNLYQRARDDFRRSSGISNLDVAIHY